MIRILFVLAAMLGGGSAAGQLSALSTDQLTTLKAQEGRRTDAAAQQLHALRARLGLDDSHRFTQLKSHTDHFGQTHSRFQQQYLGLKVWGGEAVVHLDPQGGILPLTDALQRNIHLDASARITAKQAIESATKDYQHIRPLAQLFSASAELLIYPQRQRLYSAKDAPLNAADVREHVANFRPAYHVQARFGLPEDETHFSYLVDAQSGAILRKWDEKHTAASVGAGHSEYSGSVSINTNSTVSGYELRDTTRGVNGKYGNNVVVNLDHQYGGTETIFTDADNSWGDGKDYVSGTDTGSANGQTAAVDVAYGLQGTWDYFKNIHQRNGIDDKGTATYSRVHYGFNYANAFWDDACFCMTYGDGNSGQTFSTVTAVDVVGHELVHGITSATANLVYSEESGGLNEANSDIHGTMVEFYLRGANGSGNKLPDTGGNWTHGEQFTLGNMRYMYKPSLDGRSFDAWSAELEKIDVHFSSGPMNRAFYFLSQGASADSHSDYYSPYLPTGMSGIGNDRAIRIWYRAVSVYLTSTSNYLAARTASLKAAMDLYGNNSAEHLAVRKAFGAINVGYADDLSDDLEAPSIAVSASGTSGTITLSASTSDNRGVVRVDFYVSAVYVGSATMAPFSLSLDSTRFSNGLHLFNAKAYDAAGNSATSDYANFTLDNATQQLLRDPGFEGNSGSWWGNGPTIRDTETTVPAHGGHYMAVFGGLMVNGKLAPQNLFQQVKIPDDTPYAQLSFWLRIRSSALTTAKATLKVQIRSATDNGATEGNLVATLASYSNLDKRNDYLQKTFDLSAYRGQTIQIQIQADITDLDDQVSFYLDDFALVTSRTAPVMVSISPASKAMLVNGKQQFTATVSGSADQRITWSVVEGSSGGNIDAAGNYTAPAILGDYHVRATSVADPKAMAQTSLLVTANDGSRIALLPQTVVLPPGGTQLFTAALADTSDARVWWATVWTTEGSGSINTRTGLYRAPLHTGNYVIRANSIPDDIYADAYVSVVDLTRPTALSANAVSASQVELIWTAPFGADEKTAYRIYRDGALLTTVQQSTYYVDTSLTPLTNYAYAIQACPATADCSQQTSSVTSQTLASHERISLVTGWNLLGNSSANAWNVATLFGDSAKVTSVWKWLAGKATWAFFSPHMADGGLAYASNRGLELLSTLEGGEGFWVNARSAFAIDADFSVVTLATDFRQLGGKAPAGAWNLIAAGGYSTPGEFNRAIGPSIPAPGVIPLNLTSLWAWDASRMNWEFYAPSLESHRSLTSYLQSKGYLAFGATTGRMLAPGRGFWVNLP